MSGRAVTGDRINGIVEQPQRLFLAVRPPGPLADRLARLPRTDDHGVRWVPAGNWHVTLCFLGSALPRNVIEAVDAAELPRVASVELGPEITRLGRAVVVPAHGLDDLAAILAVATRYLGTKREPAPFVGHLTLARLRNDRTRCALVGHGFEADFPGPAVELVASESAPDGSRYTTIHRWPPIA